MLNKKTVIKYTALSLVLFASSAATVLGLMPFGVGLFIGMCMAGLSPLFLAPVFVASSLVFSPDWQTLLGSCCVVIIFSALSIVQGVLRRRAAGKDRTLAALGAGGFWDGTTTKAVKNGKIAANAEISHISSAGDITIAQKADKTDKSVKAKIKMLFKNRKNNAESSKNTQNTIPEYVFLLIAPLSVLGYLPKAGGELTAILLFIIFVPIFVFVGYTFFSPVLKRGVKFRLLDHELICGGVLLSVLAMGLFKMDIYYFPIIAAVAAFAMLMAGKIYGLSGALIVGLCFGFGCAAADYQIIWLAYYPVMALLAAVFIPTPRVISAVAVMIGYALVTYFFGVDQPKAYMFFAALSLGGLVYALIPKKKLAVIKNALCPEQNPAGARYNINLLRQNAAQSIYKTGEVFEEMSRFVASGADNRLNLPPLIERIRQEVCAGCGKRCVVKDSHIGELINISVEKGRATIVDLPAVIIESCKFSASMISATARVADEYHQKQLQKDSEKLAKSIVSEQLVGVGEVLRQISSSLAPPVSYDFEQERRVKEELNYRGIYCYDAVVSPDAVTLIVDPPYNNALIEKVLKKTLKTAFLVQSEQPTMAGTVVYAPKMPAFDVVFSVVGLPKGEVSGDTHSFVKIGGDRFLMSLCDGMGSGVAAERFSSGAISLIECFYRAGFDHASVIKSVNRFLSLSGEEAFTAADICVLDLSCGVADIFKIGSPACYIKSAESVRAIEGSSLPIGALDEIRPSFSQSGLESGDMIVLVSDGIADCFEGDALAAQISCASDISPKALCEQVLEAARSRCKRIRDDMTVCALRIFDFC